MPRALVARSLVIATLAVVVAPALAQNPFDPPAATSPFVGQFSGDGTQMTLAADGRGGFTGQFVINGASYPITATETDGRLTGTFTANGQPFQFTGHPRNDGTLVINSGTGSRTLRRAGAPAPQPQPPQPPVPPVVTPQPPTPPIGPNPNPPVAGDPRLAGGVGVRCELKDGKFVVAAVAPGSPAERSKVPVGGILRAVEGKPVDGLTMEQVGGMVRGEPGSYVTLTIETANEVATFVLQRAGGAPQPSPNPPPVVAPNAANDVIRPGVRLTYASNAVQVPDAASFLVQDDDGQWVDPQTRQAVRVDTTPTMGGSAYQQATIVAADGQQLAADLRFLLVTDLDRGEAIQTQLGMVAGSPATGLGDYWAPPARLASMPDGEQNGYTFKRVPFPLDGKTYDAMSVKTRQPQGYQHNVYDLATGLLLASASSTQVPAPGTQGPPQPGQKMTTMVTTVRLVGRRTLDVPWAGQAMPAWAKAGTRLAYAGTYEQGAGGIGGGGQPMKVDLGVTIANVGNGWISATQVTRLEGGPQPMPEQTTQRAIGNFAVDPFYIDPRILGQLRADQTIDDDAKTGRKFVFAGVRGDAAVLELRSAAEQTRYFYDPRTGVLNGFESTTRVMGNASTIKMKLTNPPAN